MGRRLADIFQEIGKVFMAAAVAGGFIERVALDAVLMLICASVVTFLVALQIDMEGDRGQD